MPAFTRPAPAAIVDFNVRLAVTDASGAAPVVDILFSATVVDNTGAPVARPAGDLRPFLTAQQQANFETAALALYAKAKTELLA